jgi:hypothetical protein
MEGILGLVEKERGVDQYETCDRCTAVHAVTVSTDDNSATLIMCGHHYAHHEAALLLSGWHVVVDKRPGLTAR